MEQDKQTVLAIERLERQLEALFEKLDSLREENRSLHVRQESLMTERAGLVARNDEARSRVEAMIGRLKVLESS